MIAKGETQGWITAFQAGLLRQAVGLLRQVEHGDSKLQVVDFGYIIFSAAKAYEGFLKTFFWQSGLISKQQYLDDHFRIGAALNPDLPYKYRNHNWLYDDVAEICGKETAQLLWETWRTSRNQVFHYFPDQNQGADLPEARQAIEAILKAMEAAMAGDGRRKWSE